MNLSVAWKGERGRGGREKTEKSGRGKEKKMEEGARGRDRGDKGQSRREGRDGQGKRSEERTNIVKRVQGLGQVGKIGRELDVSVLL